MYALIVSYVESMFAFYCYLLLLEQVMHLKVGEVQIIIRGKVSQETSFLSRDI